ncbi:MAG TPA: hypothetical protein VGJ75_13490, partial [Dongiaceae bacterium]
MYDLVVWITESRYCVASGDDGVAVSLSRNRNGAEFPPRRSCSERCKDRYWFIDWKKSLLVLECFSLSS